VATVGGAHGAIEASTVSASSVGNVLSSSTKTLTLTQEQEALFQTSYEEQYNMYDLE